MGKSNTWHPGFDRVAINTIIPIPLLPDEILSSWLTRAALFQGCDPLVLTGALWPKWRAWTRDLDRGVDDKKINTLARISGVNQSILCKSTLRPIVSAITSETLDDLAIWPWTLALGSRNRKRISGIQYCPKCLAEDKRPYFRIQWRLAWHTTCVQHKIMLLDRCPICGASLEPHRLSSADNCLAVCATCKCDLRETKGLSISKDALNFQQEVDHTVKSCQGIYGDGVMTSIAWFALCRYFLTLLRRAASGKTAQLLTMFMAMGVNAKILKPPATGLSFEMLPVSERHFLLENVNHLIMIGPERFITAAKSSLTSVSSLHDSRTKVPSCIGGVIRLIPSSGVHTQKTKRVATNKARSKQSILHMWARLQRKVRISVG